MSENALVLGIGRNNPHMSRILLLCVDAVVLILGFVLSAIAGENAPRPVFEIGLSKSPASLPVLRMMESRALENVEIKAVVWSSPEQLIAMAQSGKTRMFSLPLTVAARLHARGLDVKITNVNTWGGIRLVTSDPGIAAWPDLKGKQVFIPPRTSPPDALMRYFLARAGLDPDSDLRLVRASVTEIAQLLRAGRIDSAVLTEPHATAVMTGNASLRVAMDFEEEWRKATGDGIPTLGFGGLGSFLDGNPDFVNSFENAYRESVDWILGHPEEAGMLAEKHLGMNARTIADAVPNLGLRYRSAGQARREVDAFFHFLDDQFPGESGETPPDATFYWQ